MKIDFAGYLQAGVAGLVATAGTVFWAGSSSSTLHQTQAQVQQLQTQQQADHDKIVTQDQKLDDINSTVKEIRGDVKDLARRVH